MKRVTPRCECGHFIYSHTGGYLCHACPHRKMRHPFKEAK